jgi:N-acetylgalactosamine kinase
MIRTALKPGAYTLEQLQSALGTTDIVGTFLPDRRDAAALVFAHNREFKLRDRALHVIEEAERVRAFHRICLRECGFADRPEPEDILDRLGALMNASHESCRSLYECSHPQLDLLVEACRRAGAKGSRLTGAGWGGCCVSLVHKDEVAAFIERVWQEYFRGGSLWSVGLEAGKGGVLFATRPGPGASVVELE